MFQRMLVPVDGSGPSRDAVGLAIATAAAVGGTLIFCSVVDSDRIVMECAAMPFVDPTPSIDGLKARANEALAAAVARAEGMGLRAESMLKEGEPVKTVLSMAHLYAADLIVMGSHGRRGLQRLLLGSTTEGVLREADIPVLVVRGGCGAVSGELTSAGGAAATSS
ncbi:MAG: universal stress protein [Vulcanimicrobiaceae bacterium]